MTNKILIGLHEFDGPFLPAPPKAEPGILALLILRMGRYEILDVRSFENMTEGYHRVLDECCRQPLRGTLALAVHPMPGFSRSERTRVIDEIWQELAMCEQAA